MRIAIAADHNGVELKARLVAQLGDAGHEVDDRGVHDADQIVDYPLLCQDLCRRVVAGSAERGIVVGGSGSGEHMACNKIAGVRAGLASDRFTCEISRAHNDANVLVIGAKVLDADTAQELLDLWLTTPFKGGRHQDRVDQLAALDRGETL
ncbi:RpiB/LacA/LacB family sugar-phosphate isomerase [uncultured Jatrophihabitans sp.]|uniref:RpiB/LacA/LacB family sugar-phosphate isomerase n=1 Tax=uncultured Jatrophihabitans sp. TaxID=1610747 RepID=UPI0035CA3D4D